MPRVSLLILVLALAGCSEDRAEPNPRTKQHAEIAAFQSSVHVLGEGERLTVADIPGRYATTRCVIYSNERTKSSNLSCEYDSPNVEPVEADGPEQESYGH